ncbi:MAG TPA: N-acetylglucosamine-6-phosphate deacetylase [Candidatus Atribacteria bacterium]|nr:N-acetylglucosamine-6-phosphate deacetylase [Candidatus Atribacteria bacterium]HQE25724.1 N-acetylglucosamine-6-phosphate deacetylase [Candidatus Atribacteria bacterium]
MGKILFQNFRVLTPFRILENHSIVVEGNKIRAIGEKDIIKAERDMEIVNGQGLLYLSPGFIDIHVHGGGGADCLEGTREALEVMARSHARGGTTAFCPTITTAPLEQIFQSLEAIREIGSSPTGGARILGAHVEGPYFSPVQRGAQNPDFLRLPSREDLEKFLSYREIIKRISLAPELPGALEFGQRMREVGIMVAIGHSDATYEEVLSAIENGFSHVTHIYSAMSGVRRVNLYRVAGVIESALLRDELTVEMIADGKHLPPHLMQFIIKNKGLGQVCAVTDAMEAAGMPEGEYEIGGLRVIVEEGVAKLEDRSAFAGSVATMDLVLKTLVHLVGLPLGEAIQLVSFNPARFLGLDHRQGIIAPGKDADLLILDPGLEVKMTMVQGEIVYDNLRKGAEEK